MGNPITVMRQIAKEALSGAYKRPKATIPDGWEECGAGGGGGGPNSSMIKLRKTGTDTIVAGFGTTRDEALADAVGRVR